MSDLIDRQAAIDALEREKSLVERPITETRWFDFGLGKAQDVLNELPSAQPEHATCYLDSPCEYQNPGIKIPMPTADAVEVVRCKDCAIRFDSCPMVVRVGSLIQFFTDDEDFCSRGRREANGDGQ